MQQLDWNTHNIVNDNLQALKQIFPEAFSEDKVDIEKLKLLLWEDISNDKERYSFTWKGKSDAIKLALAQNTWTLRPDKESSKNWDTTQNLYLEWDNLEILRVLQDSYRGKIKMIYIDPPYNTWKDFVYKDDFHDNVGSYKEKMQENMKSNPETNGRYHTDWLNMMYPRLKLARNLLKDDGVIFISIDDNEVHNLRKICDEIFGEENFIAQIIWERAFAPVNLKHHFSESHDYIICIAKHKDKLWKLMLSRSNEANNRYQNPDNDPRGDWTSWDFSVWPAVQHNIYEIVNPAWKKLLPPNWRSWRVSQEKFKELLQDNRVWFWEKWNNVPRLKRFLSDVKDWITPMTLWKYTEVWHSQDATKRLKELFWDKHFFDYSKPIDLIKRCIDIQNSEIDSIILDFFSWSATTAHAVMQLNAEDGWNRKFIMAQIPEETEESSEANKAGYKNICEIWKERIRRAGEKIKEENKDKEWIENLDIGFKVFKLDTTNLKKWETSVEWENEEEIQNELQKRLQDMGNPVKEDRDQIDMIYEIMLKNGMDLTLPMKELDIQGKKVFSIASNYLIACLEKDINLEVVKEIQALNPKVVVFYDDSFKDDVVKVNAVEQLEKQEIQVRVI